MRCLNQPVTAVDLAPKGPSSPLGMLTRSPGLHPPPPAPVAPLRSAAPPSRPATYCTPPAPDALIPSPPPAPLRAIPSLASPTSPQPSPTPPRSLPNAISSYSRSLALAYVFPHKGFIVYSNILPVTSHSRFHRSRIRVYETCLERSSRVPAYMYVFHRIHVSSP